MTSVRRTSPVQDAQSLAEALRPILHRLHRQLRRETPDSGISPLQNLLLAVIQDHPGIGVSDLARVERLRGPTISAHVKVLETSGLVRRLPPDPDDRRRVGLILTDRGKAIVDHLRRSRTDWLARELGKLPLESRQAIRAALDPLSELGR